MNCGKKFWHQWHIAISRYPFSSMPVILFGNVELFVSLRNAFISWGHAHLRWAVSSLTRLASDSAIISASRSRPSMLFIFRIESFSASSSACSAALRRLFASRRSVSSWRLPASALRARSCSACKSTVSLALSCNSFAIRSSLPWKRRVFMSEKNEIHCIYCSWNSCIVDHARE